MTADFPVTIYHDPTSATSRGVLAMIVAAGYMPGVVNTRAIGWTRPLLIALLAVMDAGPRALLRATEPLAGDLHLLDPQTGDAAILDAMIAHPGLVDRPIVVTPKGVALCRPSDTVLTLLDRPISAFAKADREADHPIAA